MPRSAKAGTDGTDDACVLGPARARREQHRVGLESQCLVDRDLIVAHDDRVGTEFAEILHEVVDEAVVAVDHKNSLALSRHQTAAEPPVVSNVFCGLCSHAVAPPKRKTSGRVTPKGTRPGQATTTHEPITTSSAGVSASSRYTPPTPKDFYESPRWVPILMLVPLGHRRAGDLVAIRHLGHDQHTRAGRARVLAGWAVGRHEVALTQLTLL